MVDLIVCSYALQKRFYLFVSHSRDVWEDILKFGLCATESSRAGDLVYQNLNGERKIVF